MRVRWRNGIDNKEWKVKFCQFFVGGGKMENNRNINGGNMKTGRQDEDNTLQREIHETAPRQGKVRQASARQGQGKKQHKARQYRAINQQTSCSASGRTYHPSRSTNQRISQAQERQPRNPPIHQSSNQSTHTYHTTPNKKTSVKLKRSKNLGFEEPSIS